MILVKNKCIIFLVVCLLFASIGVAHADENVYNGQNLLIAQAASPIIDESELDGEFYGAKYEKPKKEKVHAEEYYRINTKYNQDEVESGYRYLKVWQPCKDRICGGTALEKDTLWIRTRFLYRWSVGKFDKNWNYHSYGDDEFGEKIEAIVFAHYALTNRLGIGIRTGYRRRTAKTQTWSQVYEGFIDSSIGASYMFLYDPDRIHLRATASVIFPIGVDEFIGDDYRYHASLHATFPIRPINLYASLGYTFRTKDYKSSYDDILRGGLGIEYFNEPGTFSIGLGLSGVAWGNSVSRVTNTKGVGFDMFGFRTHMTYKPGNSNMTILLGFSHNFMGKGYPNPYPRFNHAFMELQWAFHNLFGRNK
jgi:hypothetical protein